MTTRTSYDALRTDAATAARLVRDGDTVVLPIAAGEAPTLLDALSARRHELRGVTVSQMLPLHEAGYLDPDTADHVRHGSLFLGAPTRRGAAQGWVDVVPANFSQMPGLYRGDYIASDVVFALASPMDEDGFFSLGLAPSYVMAALERARAVVLEVNPAAPYCQGDCRIHVSQVTALVESDAPLPTAELPEIGPVQQAIAGYVADLVPDGATLQIGIGAIPDAVVRQLADKNDLGIHTEMLGDGILRLVESGVVTNRRKNANPGKILATFAMGSSRLYEFMDHNPALEMQPADVTNDPYLAGRNDLLHSINGSVQVDLMGQCGSESIGARPYSGTGGQLDFVRAASISRGGKSFIVLPSTAKGGTVSRIVPTLAPGTHVSTGKNEVNYVVTEYGVAQLRGLSLRDRARVLVDIAHPDFRAELSDAAARVRPH